MACAAYSPDGRLLVTGGVDGTVRWWDAETGRPVRTTPVTGSAVRELAFTPDGTRLASGWRDDQVRVWDAATGQECLALPTGAAVTAVRFSADGTTLTALTTRGPLRWHGGPQP